MPFSRIGVDNSFQLPYLRKCLAEVYPNDGCLSSSLRLSDWVKAAPGVFGGLVVAPTSAKQHVPSREWTRPMSRRRPLLYMILHPSIGKSKRSQNDHLVWGSIIAVATIVEFAHSPLCPVLRRWIGVGTNARRRKFLSGVFVAALAWFAAHILTLP